MLTAGDASMEWFCRKKDERTSPLRHLQCQDGHNRQAHDGTLRRQSSTHDLIGLEIRFYQSAKVKDCHIMHECGHARSKLPADPAPVVLGDI